MSEPSDLRGSDRYTLSVPLEAVFGATAIGVRNVGERGVLAEHADPLKIGAVGRAVFTLPASSEKIALRGRVVWSRLSTNPDPKGKLRYVSGIHFDEGSAFPREALERLVQLGLARLDERSIERKREAQQRKERQRTAVRSLAQQREEIPHDQLLLVQHAIAQLRGNPQEAQKWYQRARFSPPVQDGAALPYREDVVAIWEYLGRLVDIDLVARVVGRK